MFLNFVWFKQTTQSRTVGTVDKNGAANKLEFNGMFLPVPRIKARLINPNPHPDLYHNPYSNLYPKPTVDPGG